MTVEFEQLEEIFPSKEMDLTIPKGWGPYPRRAVGIYHSPRQLKIAGIPTVITDPHNEVFGYWFNQFHGQQPAVLLHIDAHSDSVTSPELMERLDKGEYPHEYAKKSLGIATFIAPAVHYGLVDKVFWINPYNGFKTTRLSPEIVVHRREGKSQLAGLLSFGKESSKQELVELLNSLNQPPILDIDLDAFVSEAQSYECEQPEFCDKRLSIDLPRLEFDLSPPISRTIHFLKQVQTPGLITIARSQTPRAYIHPKSVDVIQEITLGELNRLYSQRLQEVEE